VGFIKTEYKLLKTTDGGVSWTEVPETSEITFSHYQRIHFLDKQMGWLVGFDKIAITKDGGATWSVSYEKTENQQSITSAQFVTASTGYITLDRGDMMKTLDGGVTWQDVNPYTNFDLLNLHFISPDSGIVVGRGGRILSTVDGGQHFTKNYSVTSKDLYSIHIINQNKAWITGEKGTLLTTSPGTELFTSINENHEGFLPQTISLKQNYPNPFNPTTTISYQIPDAAHVTIQVFNLMGQQVATLVNTKQQAGDHQVSFNATDLASGIYFYRINTDSYSQTKKMMLIK
jgi:hypothetical protein